VIGERLVRSDQGNAISDQRGDLNGRRKKTAAEHQRRQRYGKQM